MEDDLFAGHTHVISTALASAAAHSTGSTQDLLDREAGYRHSERKVESVDLRK
jgi:hypothetical protein